MKDTRQIRVISQTKKGANAEEGLTGNNEFVKLAIMSSQSCIDKYSDERDQRRNYIETQKL